MNILGMGPLELVLIVVIMLVVLGPKETINTGYRIGRGIRKIIRSPAWSEMMNASREIREAPARLIREAGLQENLDQFQREAKKAIEPAMESIAAIGEEIPAEASPAGEKAAPEEK